VQLSRVVPEYSTALKNAGIGGAVILDATINPDGIVDAVRTVSAPDPDLERAAIDAVRQWRYSVTLLNCEPIEVRMRVTVRFDPGS
jgi:TonB family protein